MTQENLIFQFLKQGRKKSETTASPAKRGRGRPPRKPAQTRAEDEEEEKEEKEEAVAESPKKSPEKVGVLHCDICELSQMCSY